MTQAPEHPFGGLRLLKKLSSRPSEARGGIFAVANLYAEATICVPSTQKCEDPSTSLGMTGLLISAPNPLNLTSPTR